MGKEEAWPLPCPFFVHTSSPAEVIHAEKLLLRPDQNSCHHSAAIKNPIETDRFLPSVAVSGSNPSIHLSPLTGTMENCKSC